MDRTGDDNDESKMRTGVHGVVLHLSSLRNECCLFHTSVEKAVAMATAPALNQICKHGKQSEPKCPSSTFVAVKGPL